MRRTLVQQIVQLEQCHFIQVLKSFSALLTQLFIHQLLPVPFQKIVDVFTVFAMPLALLLDPLYVIPEDSIGLPLMAAINIINQNAFLVPQFVSFLPAFQTISICCKCFCSHSALATPSVLCAIHLCYLCFLCDLISAPSVISAPSALIIFCAFCAFCVTYLRHLPHLRYPRYIHLLSLCDPRQIHLTANIFFSTSGPNSLATLPRKRQLNRLPSGIADKSINALLI